MNRNPSLPTPLQEWAREQLVAHAEPDPDHNNSLVLGLALFLEDEGHKASIRWVPMEVKKKGEPRKSMRCEIAMLMLDGILMGWKGAVDEEGIRNVYLEHLAQCLKEDRRTLKGRFMEEEEYYLSRQNMKLCFDPPVIDMAEEWKSKILEHHLAKTVPAADSPSRGPRL